MQWATAKRLQDQRQLGGKGDLVLIVQVINI